MLCTFNTFTRKYFHFARVILTKLSSTYHFWGVHNPYKAKSANSILESKVKLVCFSFFHFRFSFFIFRYWFFVIRFQYSFFDFGFSLFTFPIRFLLFIFVFHFLFFDVQNRASIVSSNGRRPLLLSYFDIRSEAEYSIFYIQNPILTFELGPNIVYAIHHNETKKRDHVSKIVRAIENLKLSHGGSSYR